MKKSILISGVVLSASILFGSNANAQEVTGDGNTIVKENGWMVIQDSNPNTSTILATITEGDVDGDGFMAATNKYDKEDVVYIDKEEFEIGDDVLITFEEDDVVNVSIK